MKISYVLRCATLAFCAGTAFAQTQPTGPASLGNVQDERAADIEAVQAAIKNTGNSNAKAAILADFARRENQRAAEAGAASLQAELARQAAASAATPQIKTQRNAVPNISAE